MKKKSILGVALTLMLLGSLMAMAAPVSGATLDWSSVTLPTTTNKILQPGTDVRDFAIAGDEETIYAVSGIGGAATLQTEGGNSATAWSIAEVYTGTQSAELKLTAGVGASDAARVSVSVVEGITLNDITSVSFWWMATIPTTDVPIPYVTFAMDLNADGTADTWVAMASNPVASPQWPDTEWFSTSEVASFTQVSVPTDFDLWHVPVALDANYLVPISTPTSTLADIKVVTDSSYGDLGDNIVLEVKVGIGLSGYSLVETAYVDDIRINNSVIYKSTDAGESWSDVTLPGDADSPLLVAVAPDDSDIMAIVADDIEVFLTTNGGSTWGALAAITDCTEIRDIDISAEKVGKHYIAVAGVENGTAQVWYYNYGDASPSWNPTNALAGFSDTGADVAAAVEFSPNFTSDEVLTALIGNYTANIITLEMFSFDSDKWNAEAGFTDWPAEVVEETITVLTTGSITLDPDYLGSDDAMRMVFVGLYIDGTAAENGIYRVDDVLVKAIKEGASVDINSVAYNGLNLVAGEVNSNTTYYCADPTATTPTVSPTSTYKRAGGEANVVVAWAGDEVVAGTSGDESCFAVSTNDGKSYNDISIIDTSLTNLRDVAVSPDGETVFVATDDGEDLSLLRNASSWERVLSVQDKKDFLIRIAPDDADVVYMAEKGASTIYYSADSGETRWQLRTCGVSIQDLAVETDGDVSYALKALDGKVSKSTNSGFTWGSPESTKLNGGNMIVSLGEDKLMVGSDDSYVAYSADGNDSWTKVVKPVVTGGDNVQVIASGVADDDYIYAAAKAADYIYRWQIGESAVWDKIYTSAVTGNVTGMALQGKIFYAVATDGADSKAYRTTNATLFPDVFWSTMAKDDVVFGVTPQSLKVGGGTNKLWAIDTVGDDLYSYTDTLIDIGPTLVSPKQDFSLKINPVTGKSSQVTFVWERPSDEVTAYDLKIAFDAGFDEEVAGITVSETATPISQIVGPGKALFFESPASTETTKVYVTGEIEFMPDTTYFWRVRVSIPVKSQYSEVRRFVVEKSEVTPPVVVEIPPAPPTPQITVTVPPPTKVEIPPAPPAPAPITPAYIWAIIIIGAILVIALVILIVRTRRVV